MFVKSLSANALKCISLLTNFSFHATQKTKRQKKRFCAKISQNPFVYCFLLTPCPAPPKVVSRGVGKIQIPHMSSCNRAQSATSGKRKRTATDPLDGQSKDLGSFSHLEKEHLFFILLFLVQRIQFALL